MDKHSSDGQLDLPWPYAWEVAHRKTSSLRLARVATVIFLAVTALIYVTRYPSFAIFMLGLATVVGLLLLKGHLVTLAARRKGVLGISRATISGRDFSIPYVVFSRAVTYTETTLSIVTFIYAATLPLYMDDIPFASTHWTGRHLVVGLIASLAAIYVVPFLVARVARWRQPLGIALAPEGVYHWSWFGRRFLPWDDITEARPVLNYGPSIKLICRDSIWTSRPGDSALCWFGFFRRYMCTIHAGYLAVDPAIAYYGILFYLKNPDHRHELATDAGVERLRRMDFPPSLAEELSDSAKA